MAKWNEILLAVVCLCAGAPGVMGQTYSCREMEYCEQVFIRAVSHLQHDRNLFCLKLDDRIRCMVGTVSSCTREQQPYAHNQLAAAKGQYEVECASCHVVASLAVVSLCLVLSTLGHRFL